MDVTSRAVWCVGNRTLVDHQILLLDKTRTNAFGKAIKETVRNGDVVVDLGTGSGILSLFAWQAGARRVYAIESSGMIRLADRVSKINQASRRIRFIQGDSKSVRLPGKADVLICEFLGNFGLNTLMLSSCIDGRKRFLAKGGTIIPKRLKCFLVPVMSSRLYATIDFWKQSYGFNFSPAREPAVNLMYAVKGLPKEFLAKPSVIFDLDLQTLENEELSSSTQFELTRKGVLHGFCGWFDAVLSDKTGLSTSPTSTRTIWPQIFLPMRHPIKVGNRDKIVIKLRRTDDNKWVRWRWHIRCEVEAGDVYSSAGDTEQSFF